MDISLWTLTLLTLAAFFAGLVDTIAGGGGLIALPAILAAGLPPSIALGTNKFQATCGVAMATFRFWQKGHLNIRRCWLGILFCLIGASVGTVLVLCINDQWLTKALPILLFGVLLYSIFSPRLSPEDTHPRMKPFLFLMSAGLLLGFYDGFLGPGTGSFWVVALMFFLGFNMQKATIHAKLYNFISNAVALIWFICAGKVFYSIAICMAVGQMAGAYVGAHLVMVKGIKLIRPVFIVMVTVMLIVLVKRYWF
jgi:uncharacterized membrane protein YfcA